MIKFPNRNEVNSLDDAVGLLDRWYLSASADGTLWIEPRQPILKLQEFCILLKRIQRVFKDCRLTRLVFHFDGVEVSRNLWLIILRLLMVFARSQHADCRIIRSDKQASGGASKLGRHGEGAGLAIRGDRPRTSMRLTGISIIIKSERSLTPPIDDTGNAA